MNPSIDNVIQQVDEQEVIQFLQALVKIPSESGNEAFIAKFIEDRLNAAGIHVRNISNNIIGQLGEGDPTLVLNAHLDTVPPGDLSKWTVEPFSADIRNNRLFGRGSSDCKGGLAAILITAEIIKNADIELNGTLIVLGTAYEEVGRKKVDEHKGIIEMLDKKIIEHADAAIIAEPTDLKISLGHRAPNNFEIVVHGRPAHAAMPDQGINAIEKAAKIILALQNQELPMHEILGRGTQSVDLIEGGSRPNVVPEVCKITMDRRLTVGETPESATQEIEQLIADLKKTDPDLHAEVHCTYGSLPTFTQAETPIVTTLQKTFRNTLNRDPTLTCSRFGTDGGFIYHALNIPVVIFGPGKETLAHKADEYVETEQLAAATKVLIGTVLNFLGA
jgi:succinyl-diaminopimelate desuccinylase